MTKPKTAILWGQDDLLSQGIETFLKNEKTWCVIRIPSDQRLCLLADQLQKISPDLVVLNQGDDGERSDSLMKLLQDQPNSKVIVVSLENNMMQVYSKHSITVQRVSDLLSIIEDRYFFEHPAAKEVEQEK